MSITRFIRSLLFAIALLAISAAAYAQLSVSVSFAPPQLPVYEQPLCPGDGYLWTPGYWAYDDDEYGYYWVPGTWVMAPEQGLLWTPAYWSWGATDTFSTTAIGASRLASTAASVTAMDITVTVIKVDAGRTDSSTTTVRRAT
jgi:hypothetical protein